MKRIFLLFLIVLFSNIGIAQLTQEQQSVKKAFFDFLSLYQKNKEKFHSFKLYKGVGEKNEPPYKIQWEEVDRYCSWLKTDVPYVSQGYIENVRLGSKYYDSCFKANPILKLPKAFEVFGYEGWNGWPENIFDPLKWYFDTDTKYEVKITADTAILIVKPKNIWEKYPCHDGFHEVYFIKEKEQWKMADNIYLNCN